MSQQQIWVDLDTLARIVGEVNNDLAQVLLSFAREQETQLQQEQSTSKGWQAKATEYKRLLNANREFLQDLRATCKEYFPDDKAKQEGYATAVGDIIANTKTGDSL